MLLTFHFGHFGRFGHFGCFGHFGNLSHLFCHISDFCHIVHFGQFGHFGCFCHLVILVISVISVMGYGTEMTLIDQK